MKTTKIEKKRILLWLASNPGIDQELLKLHDNFDIIRLDNSFSEESFPRQNVAGIVTNTAPKFLYDFDFFSTFPDLEFVASPSTGITHFCAEELCQNGIEVITIKDRMVLSEISSSSEHAVFLILATIRKARMAFGMALDGTWRQDEHILRTSQLKRKTIGLVGLGRIGSCIAKVFRTLGMEILYFDPYVKSKDYKQVDNVEDLFEQCIIVAISCTLTRDTRELVNDKCFVNSKGGYLVNVARGEIINEEHVLDAIDSGALSGYSTDVLTDEVTEISNSVILNAARKNPNIIVTPHCAGLSYDSEFLAAKDIINQILER